MRNSLPSDKNKYHSNIAETIEAGGNFLNNVRSPLFIIVIFALFIICGAGYLLHDMTIKMMNGMANMSEQMHGIKEEGEKTNALLDRWVNRGNYDNLRKNY